MTELNGDSAVSQEAHSPPHPHSGLPFQWALGEDIRALGPRVQAHVLQAPGTVVVYRGRMRVWRDAGWRGKLAGWLLRVGALANTMFPETGEDVDFEMEHTVASHEDGSLSMTWIRTFRFDRVIRRFDALMRFHPDRGPVVDWIGCLGCLHVELCPRVEDGAIVILSRREWLGVGSCRLPIQQTGFAMNPILLNAQRVDKKRVGIDAPFLDHRNLQSKVLKENERCVKSNMSSARETQGV